MNNAIADARSKPGTGLLLAAALLATPTTGFAQTRLPDLTPVSIEDLMNIEITSASHKATTRVPRSASINLVWKP